MTETLTQIYAAQLIERHLGPEGELVTIQLPDEAVRQYGAGAAGFVVVRYNSEKTITFRWDGGHVSIPAVIDAYSRASLSLLVTVSKGDKVRLIWPQITSRSFDRWSVCIQHGNPPLWEATIPEGLYKRLSAEGYAKADLVLGAKVLKSFLDNRDIGEVRALRALKVFRRLGNIATDFFNRALTETGLSYDVRVLSMLDPYVNAWPPRNIRVRFIHRDKDLPMIDQQSSHARELEYFGMQGPNVVSLSALWGGTGILWFQPAVAGSVFGDGSWIDPTFTDFPGGVYGTRNVEIGDPEQFLEIMQDVWLEEGWSYFKEKLNLFF